MTRSIQRKARKAMPQQKKRIKDLVQGDIVQSDNGNLKVEGVTKVPLFEGDTWEVFTEGGKSAGMYNGNDKVALYEVSNG